MNIVSGIHDALTGGSYVALPLALGGGLIAGLNPCCLALYPAAAASCCTGKECGPRRGFVNAVAFLLGIATAMAVLGLGVSLAGRITGLGSVGRYLAAIVPLLMGTHLLGWIRLPLDGVPRFSARGGAFGIGFLVSLVIGPCGTPLLASVLSYAAYKGEIFYGTLLLFIYGLGAGLPMLVVGTTAGSLAKRLDRADWKIWVDRAAGLVLVALGFYLLWIAQLHVPSSVFRNAPSLEKLIFH